MTEFNDGKTRMSLYPHQKSSFLNEKSCRKVVENLTSFSIIFSTLFRSFVLKKWLLQLSRLPISLFSFETDSLSTAGRKIFVRNNLLDLFRTWARQQRNSHP